MTALDFIREEVYTTAAVLAEYLKKPEYDVRQELCKLVNLRLVKMRRVFFSDTEIELFLITRLAAKGKRYKQFSSFSRVRVEHNLTVQRVRANGAWSSWQSSHSLYKKDQAQLSIIPDAIASIKNPCEEILTAIIVVRKLAEPRSYRSIIQKHLQNIDRQRYRWVMFFCKTQQESDTLEGFFNVHCLDLKVKPSTYFGFYRYPFRSD